MQFFTCFAFFCLKRSINRYIIPSFPHKSKSIFPFSSSFFLKICKASHFSPIFKNFRNFFHESSCRPCEKRRFYGILL